MLNLATVCAEHNAEAHAPQLYYELYPEFLGDRANASATWFEVALHAEVGGFHPADHPESRAAIRALMDAADQLILHAQAFSYDAFELSPSHYTLHPSEQPDPAGPKLARTLSLVFSKSSASGQDAEFGLPDQMKEQLAALNVFRMQAAPAIQ